jgi:hypothetical protein
VVGGGTARGQRNSRKKQETANTVRKNQAAENDGKAGLKMILDAKETSDP